MFVCVPSLSAGGGRRWRAETKQPEREHEERKFIFLYKEKEGKKKTQKLNLRLIISRESTRVSVVKHFAPHMLVHMFSLAV